MCSHKYQNFFFIAVRWEALRDRTRKLKTVQNNNPTPQTIFQQIQKATAVDCDTWNPFWASEIFFNCT